MLGLAESDPPTGARGGRCLKCPPRLARFRPKRQFSCPNAGQADNIFLLGTPRRRSLLLVIHTAEIACQRLHPRVVVDGFPALRLRPGRTTDTFTAGTHPPGEPQPIAPGQGQQGPALTGWASPLFLLSSRGAPPWLSTRQTFQGRLRQVSQSHWRPDLQSHHNRSRRRQRCPPGPGAKGFEGARGSKAASTANYFYINSGCSLSSLCIAFLMLSPPCAPGMASQCHRQRARQ